mgnify:FL=1
MTKTGAGRPQEFDSDDVLGRATQVFWRKGFENTSLDDLLAATGLSKSSLYRSFGDKRTLFERCLAHYGDAVQTGFRTAFQAAPSGLAFIEGTLLAALDDERRPNHGCGCLVLNTANEFAQRDPEVAAVVAREIGRMRELMGEAVRRAQREGDVPAALDAAAAAHYLVCALGGMKTLAQAGVDATGLRDSVAFVLRALR